MSLTIVTTPDLKAGVALPPSAGEGIVAEPFAKPNLPCVMLFSWPEHFLGVLMAEGYSLRDAAEIWKTFVSEMLELHREHPNKTALLVSTTLEHEGGVEVLQWLRDRWPELEIDPTDIKAVIETGAKRATPTQWQLLAAKEWIIHNQEFGRLVDELQTVSASLPGGAYASPTIDVEAAVASVATEQASLRRLSGVNELLQHQLQQLEELLERYYLENRRLKERLQGKRFGTESRARRAPLSYKLASVWIGLRQRVWQIIKRLLRPLRRFTQEHRRQLKLIDMVASSEYFDAEWYKFYNPDVAAGFKNPAEHYLRYGGNEGRDPSARFSSRKYLLDNPDVAEAGLNPLVHYLQHGKAEDRAFPAP